MASVVSRLKFLVASLVLLLSLAFSGGAVAHAAPAQHAPKAAIPLVTCSWAFIDQNTGSNLPGDSFTITLYEFDNPSTGAYCGQLKAFTQYSVTGHCEDVSAILAYSSGTRYGYKVTGCVTGSGSVTYIASPPTGNCYGALAGASDIGGPGIAQVSTNTVCI